MGKQRYVKYLSNEHCMVATDNLEILLWNRKMRISQIDLWSKKGTFLKAFYSLM